MADIDNKVLDTLLELKSEVSNLSTDMRNLNSKVSGLEDSLKHLVKIENKQQRLEDKYNLILSNCENLNHIKLEIQNLKMRVHSLEESREKSSERFWKVFINILEKIIWAGIVLLLAYKDKLL